MGSEVRHALVQSLLAFCGVHRARCEWHWDRFHLGFHGLAGSALASGGDASGPSLLRSRDLRHARNAHDDVGRVGAETTRRTRRQRRTAASGVAAIADGSREHHRRSGGSCQDAAGVAQGE